MTALTAKQRIDNLLSEDDDSYDSDNSGSGTSSRLELVNETLTDHSSSLSSSDELELTPSDNEEKGFAVSFAELIQFNSY